MTDRERWTVYPLLFLALGLSLKDKMFRSVNTDEVRCKTMFCNDLRVASPQGADGLHVAGGNLQAKSLIIGDANGKQRVQITDAGVQATSLICNALVVAGANGTEAVTVSSNEQGGFVRTTGVDTGTIMFLGNTDRIAGLLFIDSHGAIHPGPIFASPVPAKNPADSETSPSDAPATPAAPPQQEPAASEKSGAEAPTEKASEESRSAEQAAPAQPD
jgi:hypothetical protein